MLASWFFLNFPFVCQEGWQHRSRDNGCIHLQFEEEGVTQMSHGSEQIQVKMCECVIRAACAFVQKHLLISVSCKLHRTQTIRVEPV